MAVWKKRRKIIKCAGCGAEITKGWCKSIPDLVKLGYSNKKALEWQELAREYCLLCAKLVEEGDGYYA